MHVVIRNYENEASDIVAQVAQRKDSLIELMSGIDGFVGYYVLDPGNGGITTVSVFQDRAGTEESIRAAAKWVVENVSQWAPNPPTVIQGDVAFHANP